MNIRTAEFETSATDLASCPPSGLPEFPLIGRSNVGKSSLINMLTSRKAIARVSSKPGHTQLINFFSINGTWRLVDLPGYGFVAGPKHLQDSFADLISDYLPQRGIIRRVFVLLDSRHEPHKIDVAFCRWLMDVRVPFALVFTKVDKLKASVVNKHVAAFLEEFPEWTNDPSTRPDVFKCSSETREGRAEILSYVESLL